ncbi:MAG: hypothetical protein OXH39_20460 [Candidatus Poribacteria bacterium]|nr:hypothetical protein [Candidatus Poribacteria bacterium]
MTRKNAVRMFIILIVLGFTTFFGFQANSQTVNTFIESIEAKHPAPDTTPEKYEGLQTVKGLMNAFDAAYNQKYSKAKVIALCEDGVVYSSELAISGEIDARHSRIEWLQMLLQRGITIEDFDDYRIYLSKRHTLAFLEDNPDLQEIGFLGMPLMDNQNAYKVAYIDKLVAKRVEDHKKQMERAKKRIESAKERIARAKKQPNPKQVEHARKQIEHATKQLRRAQEALERFQNPIPLQQPNRNMRKRSPYPPL